MGIKSFKELLEANAEAEQDNTEEKPEKKQQGPSKDSWIRTKTGWIIRFVVSGKEWTIRLSGDAAEDNWAFTWYHTGEGAAANITRFGTPADWSNIMPDVIEILKDFIRVYSPGSIRFSGFSYKSNQVYYRAFWKVMKPFRYAFRKQGYKTSFDNGNFEAAPSYVITKLSGKDTQKEPVKKDKETKKDK